jgi:molecular chaperone DnaK (HSP70)
MSLTNSALSSQGSFIVGIDLGTTNSALAYFPVSSEKDARYQVLGVEQLVAPGQVASQKVLPSFLYIPHDGEISADEMRLPWDLAASGGESLSHGVVGVWARERGTAVPDRLISSAKSWLGYSQVDRRAPILPWGSDLTASKLSPVEVSARYLRHLAAAYEYTQVAQGEAGNLAEAQVVLTVPASFDEVARSLTYEAARTAGLTQLTLLEEPLAAFYAWLGQQGESWRDHVQPGDFVLVCDVGGGTTDFSLIAVLEDDRGHLELERISVGDHLLLGGDNMDLALAFAVRQQLEAEGRTIDQWQFLSLVGHVRAAKEKLLMDESLTEVPLAIAGKGSSLFAQVISTRLTRAQVDAVILQGFFPMSAASDMPQGRRPLGIQEIGLPYEADAAISRHLARFLKRSLQNLRSDPTGKAARLGLAEDTSVETLMPTAILFNGGVFNAPLLRQRVLSLLQSWNQGHQVNELPSSELDLAVALGAAYYGRMRATGEGIRVQSGTARSYYIGLESPFPAVPGYTPPVKALCVVPQGTDEGTSLSLKDQKFGLVVGEPVEFRFFSSVVRAGDQVGTVVPDAMRELVETSSLSIALPADGHATGDVVPVSVDAAVTETGVLQIYMREVDSDRRWQVEFNVRAYDQT